MGSNASCSGESTHHMKTLGNLSYLRDHASDVRQAAAELYKELHGYSYEDPKPETAAIAKNPAGFFEEADNLINMAHDSLTVAIDIIKSLR